MERKLSSKTQRTSKSGYSQQVWLITDLVSMSTHEWLYPFVSAERTMRRLSLRCMRSMQWMCSSAQERGRWVCIWFFQFDFENFGEGKSFTMYAHFRNSGKGWRSEDHRIQKRPQQGVRLKDEDISDVLQWDGETFRHNAVHSEVAPFNFTSFALFVVIFILQMLISLFFFCLSPQGVWGGRQSQVGRGGVCQTWAAAAIQCAAWERRWVVQWGI